MDPLNRTTIVAGNGTSGSALNQFNVPIGLVVDLHWNLFVSDCNNHRVLRFFPDQFNGTIVVGSGAVETIDLHSPSGLAFDAQGYLFLSELWSSRILGQGPNGFRCLVGCEGVAGSAANQLDYPHSLTFDRDGNLFVADSANERIQKFVLARNSCGESTRTQNSFDDEEIFD